MPNWCLNHLTITHEDPAKLQVVADAYNSGKFLATLLPYPKELDITAGSFGDPDEQEKHRLLEAANREAYGYSNWYDHHVEEWGTKWDFGKSEHEDPIEIVNERVEISFDTAWAPPINAIQKLEEQGYNVNLKYYEPGMCYAGVYEDGYDDYYEYSNMSAEEVAANLPAELDEFFSISEQLAEWEEEQEDE